MDSGNNNPKESTGAVSEEADHVVEDYVNQWHILEQLKSSVAVRELGTSPNNQTQERAAIPGDRQKDKEAERNDAEKQEWANEWFVLPETTSSGHASDAESETLDVNDLRVDHNTHQTAIKEPKTDDKTEAEAYQEQWHVLEELKTSVKALHWSEQSSPSQSPMGVSPKIKDPSPKGISPKRKGKEEEFMEPCRRTSSGSLHSSISGQSALTNGSISGRESVGLQLVSGSLHPDTAIGTPDLLRGSQYALQIQDDHQTTGYSSEPTNRQNTSSDLSLESEPVGFASLPNRPATIGNYGANDAAPYTIGTGSNQLQAVAPSVGSLPVRYELNPSAAVFPVPDLTGHTTLSKAPLPARERLQPDGRDGPDVLNLPIPTAPSVTTFSPNTSAQTVGAPPSAGSSGVGSSLGNTSPVSNLLVGDLPGSGPGVAIGNTSNSSGLYPVIPDSAVFMPGQGNVQSQAELSNDLNNSFSNTLFSAFDSGMPLTEQTLGVVGYDQTGYGWPPHSRWQDVATANGLQAPLPQLAWVTGGSVMQSCPLEASQSSAPVSPVTQVLSELPNGVAALSLEQGRSISTQLQQQLETSYKDKPTKPTQHHPGVERTSSVGSQSLSTLLSGSPGSQDSSPVDREIQARLQEITARYLGNGSDASDSSPPGSTGSFTSQSSGKRQSNQDVQANTTSSRLTKEITVKANSVSPPSVPLPSSTQTQDIGTFSAFHVHPPASSSGTSLKTNSSAALPSHHLASNYSAVTSGRNRKPTAIDRVRAGLMDSEDDMDSPVSKLLGPQFKATQEYLGKLRRERNFDSSPESLASIETPENVSGKGDRFQSSGEAASSVERLSGRVNSSDGVSDINTEYIKQAWPDTTTESSRESSTALNGIDNEIVRQNESSKASGTEEFLKRTIPPTSSYFPTSQRQSSGRKVSLGNDSLETRPVPASASSTPTESSARFIDPSGLTSQRQSSGREASLGYDSLATRHVPASASSTPTESSARFPDPSGLTSQRQSSDREASLGYDSLTYRPVPASASSTPTDSSARLPDQGAKEGSFGLYMRKPEYMPDFSGSDTSTKQNTSALNNLPQSSSSLSSFETPLTSLVPQSKVEASASLTTKTSPAYSLSGSSTIVSYHDDAEDTDDLLSYEAALEGDIKYFRQLKQKDTPPNQASSTEMKDKLFTSSVDSSKLREPMVVNGDISSITGSADRGFKYPRGGIEDGSDEMTRKYHLSLGAGLVSPVSDSDTSKYHNSDQELEQYAAQSEEDQDRVASGLDVEEDYSRSSSFTPTIESSSSSLYRPHLTNHLPPPQDAEPPKKVTYGLYDIRSSSGPGSTNRRRRAMGLSPLPHRVPRTANGAVYVSAESTQASLPDESESETTLSKNERSVTHSTEKTQILRNNTERHRSYETTPSTEEDTMYERTSSKEHSHRRSIEVAPSKSRSHDTSRSGSHSGFDSSRRKDRPDSGRSKEGTKYRNSGGHSFRETLAILDDYVGGRRSVSNESKHSRGRSTGRYERGQREHTSSEGSEQSKELSAKNSKDLNGMWERFQESLKSSPSFHKKDSVSSHLGRLSALLSKPLHESLAGTPSNSDAEHDHDASRKTNHQSSVYSSSEISSDLTELNEGFNEFLRKPTFSQQIKLRRLLETVNLADVPTFPRLRRDETSSNTSSTTGSDTSTTETLGSLERHRIPVIPSRSHRGSRKVSRTPVLEPSSRSRAQEPIQAKSKCICSGHILGKQAHGDIVQVTGGTQTTKDRVVVPRTRDVAVNYPTPKYKPEKQINKSKSKGSISVAVQTHLDSDEEFARHSYPDTYSRNIKEHGKEASRDKGGRKSSERERLIAGQNSPFHRPHYGSQSSKDDSVFSHSTEISYTPEKHPSQHKRVRPIASHNSPALVTREESRACQDIPAPAWFYPVTNKHYSRPSEPGIIQPANLKSDDQTVKTFSPPAAASSSMQRLTLQEAFQFAKPDFVGRSRARLNRIGRNKIVRERGDSRGEAGDQRVTKMDIPAKSPVPGKKPPVRKHPHADKLHYPRPRRFSKKEMKDLNQKLYENLPEVKAKNDENRRIAFYKTNRLKAQLYDKRVRDRLKKRYTA